MTTPARSTADDLLIDLLARPAPDDAGPERLRTLLELLDRPDRAVATIRVGGGPGKSSVVAMTVALLTALDVTAGSLTTSHVQDLRERIRISGVAISGDALREQVAYLDPFLREVDARFPRPLPFDEALGAVAANWFVDAPVDGVVIEGPPPVGTRADVVVTLGGRYGATVGTDDDAPARLGGTDFGIVARAVAVGGQQLTLRGRTGDIGDVFLPLHGEHQAANAAAALAAVEGFMGFADGLDAELVRRALAGVRLAGRLEVVRRSGDASVLLDAASDETAAAALALALHEAFPDRRSAARFVEPGSNFAVRNRVAVVGVGRTDPQTFIQALAPAIDHVIVAPSPAPVSEVAATDAVVAAVRAADLPVERAETVGAALELASGLATGEDVIVVTGGLQTVGAARTALGLTPIDDLHDPS